MKPLWCQILHLFLVFLGLTLNKSGRNSGQTSDIVQLKKVFVLKKIQKSTKMFDCFIKEMNTKQSCCFSQVKVY